MQMQMDEKELLSVLLKALPLVAIVTGGFATVTDYNGRMLESFNSRGEKVKGFEGITYNLGVKCLKERSPFIGNSQFEPEAQAWAIPVGSHVIACTNTERVRSEQNLKLSLEKALPLIAKVVGGEAVIFDREGKMITCYDAYGNLDHKFNNKVSESARKAMEINESIIGESPNYPGAIEVRIPITRNYGLGFNNELTSSKNRMLLDEVKKFQYARYNFTDIIGESEGIRNTINESKRIAKGNSTVLIFGETGTGKELFAQSIHNASSRCHGPFVALNCGAIPQSLIESQLFGYVEGAFTDAKKGGAAGAFEQANGGTIFLDEISEMDLNLQIKLLRVLQEREITRIGGSKPIRIDVRIIASSNKNLLELVSEGKFRSDLYYRLNVVQVNIPPLRERMADIPLLVNNFIGKYNFLLGRQVTQVEPEVLSIMQNYAWPGNVRELQNCIEYAINMVEAGDSKISDYNIPQYIYPRNKPKKSTTGKKTLEEMMFDSEREILIQYLGQARYKKKEAAKMLGISVSTLWRKMQQHRLQL